MPLVLFLLLAGNLFAQTGGSNAYNFLKLNYSARTASMGGNTISVRDHDLGLAINNPSLLNPSMNRQLSMSIVDYFAGITYGNAAWCSSTKHDNTWSAGINYVSYGSIAGTEANGEESGTSYTAGDYAGYFSWSSPVGNLYKHETTRRIDTTLFIGVSGKFIYSTIADYYSFAIGSDAGLTYINTAKGITAAFVIRHLGMQLRSYYPKHNERLPFEMQAGISKKLGLAPLRLSLTLHNLQRPDLTVNADSSGAILTADETAKKISVAEKAMRHAIIGAELLISKSFNIRFGYNYQRRRELGVDSRMAMAGFSIGAGIRISKIQLSYGRAVYHLAGPANHFSLGINFGEFVSRKRHYYREK